MTVDKLRERIEQYWLLARFDSPIGILILLWPTLWALWIASEGHPNGLILTVFCLGVILMRAAGCVINDYADKDFDPFVERTKLRPIAAGRVKPKEALFVFALLCLTAFALVLLLNWQTIALSFIGAFLAASYPFMKRYTHLPQAYLGMAFGFAVPMAFAAETAHIPAVAWILYLAVLLWALVYDTMYAMVDIDDDLKIGVKSTAILFGNKVRWFPAILQAMILPLPVSQPATLVTPVRPPWSGQVPTGSVPAMYTSVSVFGQAGVAGIPDCGSISTLTTPSGAVNSLASRYSR